MGAEAVTVYRTSIGEVECRGEWQYAPSNMEFYEVFCNYTPNPMGTEVGDWVTVWCEEGRWLVGVGGRGGAIVRAEALQVRLLMLMTPEEVRRWHGEKAREE